MTVDPVPASAAASAVQLAPVDFIETELSRFTAVVGKVTSKSYGRYGVEFIVARDQKDDVWLVTDEAGYEVVVAVFKRRTVGIPDPAVLDQQFDASWQTVDGDV